MPSLLVSVALKDNEVALVNLDTNTLDIRRMEIAKDIDVSEISPLPYHHHTIKGIRICHAVLSQTHLA